MWAFGCVFAELIFKFERFFNGVERKDALLEIMQTLGTPDLLEYMYKYNIAMTTQLRQMFQTYAPVPFIQYVNSHNEHIVTENSLDLLDKLLKYDHQERLTAKEALEHPYFRED